MKLAYLELQGFRGYRKPVRIDFGEGFTIIDGRNGVGKSTVFDAIEFALTGELSKYNDSKASGQSVADYIWWTGQEQPAYRYVEVGFLAKGEIISVRREQLKGPTEDSIRRVRDLLCDTTIAPADPIAQLCASAIIRDEHITSLSLDLKETDRYALLRDALGANDSDAWIEQGAQLAGLAKKRTAAAQQDVNSANADVATAARRIDEVRATLASDTALGEAVQRLRTFTNTNAAPDQLSAPVRERIAQLQGQIELLSQIGTTWLAHEANLSLRERLVQATEEARLARTTADQALTAAVVPHQVTSATALAEQAKRLVQLISLGRTAGLQNGQCPLCAKGQTHTEFEHGLAAAEDAAKRLNEGAALAAAAEEKRATAQIQAQNARKRQEDADSALASCDLAIQQFNARRDAAGLPPNARKEAIEELSRSVALAVENAQRDLRVLDTIRSNAELERATRAEADAKARATKAQEKYSRARKAEVGAHALHDAARRAASETLDGRLERVLPLLSELYRRLRPHPVWTNIEYSIRGDIRRFMKLQVGDDLNPQFLFSSGQRRATGLAFLLSVNLSLTWSRWRTILLDDPVQHVDDFRTVHLAEVAAQLVAEGRQVVCAVEDAALADLLCRRLPVSQSKFAKRVSLGFDSEGALAKVDDRWLPQLIRHSLVRPAEQSAAG